MSGERRIVAPSGAAIRWLDSPGVSGGRGDTVETGVGQSGKASGSSDLNGVGDGYRTRDIRIHNPALYP